MHWIAGEMLSVRDIGRIDKPLVWTLHDMWSFCGAEHYTDDERWLHGYRGDNRPIGEAGFDLNRWIWNRKRSSWISPMHIVAPSQWLADCARRSVLMRDWPISTVPYFIDTDTWKPVEKAMARDLLGLPQQVPLALFGALGGATDTRKGFDLLKVALELLRGQVDDLELIVFGQAPPRTASPLGFPVHYAGHLHDDLSLRVLYSAADVFVLPSRLDNLPNTGLEAHACGTPVVGFKVGGIPDIVLHEVTGYLAEPYEPDDLAKGILQVVSDPLRQAAMSRAARDRACVTWCSKVVADGYRKVYQAALGAAV
jgi:glycosyltransferase involved in cell wall biosynthesis